MSTITFSGYKWLKTSDTYAEKAIQLTVWLTSVLSIEWFYGRAKAHIWIKHGSDIVGYQIPAKTAKGIADKMNAAYQVDSNEAVSTWHAPKSSPLSDQLRQHNRFRTVGTESKSVTALEQEIRDLANALHDNDTALQEEIQALISQVGTLEKELEERERVDDVLATLTDRYEHLKREVRAAGKAHWLHEDDPDYQIDAPF